MYVHALPISAQWQVMERLGLTIFWQLIRFLHRDVLRSIIIATLASHQNSLLTIGPIGKVDLLLVDWLEVEGNFKGLIA